MVKVLNFVVAMFAALSVTAGDVLVVRGTSSLPNDGERNYAGSLIRGMGRFLDGLGIEWDQATDDEATAGLMGRYAVVILPYNTVLQERQLKEIRSYTGSGGKLMVFYSADERLAALMGFRLGKYLSDEVADKWCAVRFTADAPAGMPEVFYQESRNIRPVYPLAAPAGIIAFWEDSSGRKTQYPAIVGGSKGMWMSHVLLSDMDEEGKKLMLLEAISTYAPEVEKKAAAKYLLKVEKPGSFDDFNAYLAFIDAGMTNSVVGYLKGQYEKIRGFASSGQDRKVISGCIELRREMESLYVQVKLAGLKGRVGVWDHSGRGLYPGNWRKTIGVLKRAGVTDIYCNLLWPWESHYKSELVGESRTYKALGDQAQATIEAAHEAGLKVHLWKVCWNMESAPVEVRQSYAGKGRLQQDAAGRTVNWLCPSHPDNVRLEKDVLREAMKKYDFDGVHLDYIRYKDSSVCFCRNCRETFERWSGVKVANWPAGVRQGEAGKKYSEWRVKQISDYVRDADTMTAKLRPQAEMSAAVFGKYPSCVPSVAQDWVDWGLKGYIDYICPMNYTADLTLFNGYIDSQIALLGDAKKVMPGIGVSAKESRLDVFQVVDQIYESRKRNTGGLILFDLNRGLEQELLNVMERSSSP